ncbi:Uncharacterized protein Adt_18041 [Abeliophyllum distichum]|uniref:Uncharacterized protein n=1 Tax=Abeliophyllum distichum TaxID=126358 RepID=A0ABD1TI89_9LAMI
MKPPDRYDCFIVFSHRDRGLPAHDHFKIPNCPTSNSGWKNRYFFVKPVDGVFPFPLDWGIPPFEDFNSTSILTEPEIDLLIILRAIAPLGWSMNDVLMDDALVSVGIGRPCDMSADKFTEDFLEELARKNSRGQRKRRRDHSSADPTSSDTGTPDNSQSRNSRPPVENRQACNIRRLIEKVAEDCQAIVSYLDWEVIETSKDKSPESLERSIMVEERRVLSFRHTAFHKMRDQAEKIEQTSRALEDKSNDLRDCRRSLSEKNDLLEDHESKLTDLEKSLKEREDLLQQSNYKVRTLEENIDRLERELAVKGETAVEEYKGSEEYMTTVGIVGVRSREMAFRKSREWLTERYPNTDFSGTSFMPSIEEEDDDEDD